VQNIIETKGSMNIRKVADDYFLWERQFERQFLQYAGCSPKLFYASFAFMLQWPNMEIRRNRSRQLH
jgi:hypothetical protein